MYRTGPICKSAHQKSILFKPLMGNDVYIITHWGTPDSIAVVISVFTREGFSSTPPDNSNIMRPYLIGSVHN